jgi:ADP-dependent NAD(P)H-hydrate dehydratase / NAD(P)H-hydrate epimerase
MKVVSSEEMRSLDRRTIETHGTPGEVLMDRAGKCVAGRALRLANERKRDNPLFQLVAGSGNNGGDVFAAARHLHHAGAQVAVYLAAPEDRVSGDALLHLQQMRAAGVPLHTWSATTPYGDILIDGLLGTGVQGPLRGTVADAINYLQAAPAQSAVLAVDIPSGVHPDTGERATPCVRADVTLTIGLPKRGLLMPTAIEAVGRLEVADIGFPQTYIDELAGDETCTCLQPADVAAMWPRRRRNTHKGDYGHILMIGGSLAYSGALILAARAAMRTGAGLVTALVPASIAERVALSAPEIMVRSAPPTETGSLAHECWPEWRQKINDFDAVCIGPGLTRHAESLVWVRQLLRELRQPLVMDADALTLFAGQAHWIERANCPLVLTPHPGEFAALFGGRIEDVQADRIDRARSAAARVDATIILKGANTVIAHPGERAAVNPTGHSGMATAGSGDVLAGMTTALLGQRLPPFAAAQLAVWLHGTAGDCAARDGAEASVIASDLIAYIPAALRDLS